MTILVINSGSSSLKFQVIDSENEEVLAKGVCERIGIDGRFTYRTRTGISLKIIRRRFIRCWTRWRTRKKA